MLAYRLLPALQCLAVVEREEQDGSPAYDRHNIVLACECKARLDSIELLEWYARLVRVTTAIVVYLEQADV